MFICVIVIGVFTYKSNTLTFGIPQLLVIMFGGILYVILHEVTHGLVIKITSGFEVQYGLASFAAYAGNKNAFFDKKSYIFIALAPVVIFGLIFLLASIILPFSWFWVCVILQALNISGAVGDIYVTYITLKMPKDLLVNDLGISMIFYSAIEKD